MADQPAPAPSLPIAVSAVWGLLLFPGLIGAALSVMFFDAPGSASNPAAWLNAGIVCSFPFLCLLSIALAWLLWLQQKRAGRVTPSRAQIIAACLPLLPVAYVVAVLAFGFVAALFSGEPLGLHSTVIEH